jgi:hypothetical protein
LKLVRGERLVVSWVALLVAILLILPFPRLCRAFGEEGAFHPRPLLTGQARFEGIRSTATSRWSRS